MKTNAFEIDPYHGPSQAHGLCFSVQPGIKPPPSLRNIYKELKSDLQDGWDNSEDLNNGNLINWCKQGVLLLNACLTVDKGKPNSHSSFGCKKTRFISGLTLTFTREYLHRRHNNQNKPTI